MNKKVYNRHNLQISLEGKEVHIWNFDLDKIHTPKEFFNKILSEDELSRAEKFHFEIDKNRFICSRGFLRIVSGIYTGLPPKEIKFSFNKYGKPTFLKFQNTFNLSFNLSHSRNYVSIGFTKDSGIGIDIEFVKQLKDHKEIAKKYFSISEIEQLNSLPQEKALEGFYSCWTAKEAVIKFLGKGLSFPLKEFAVQFKELSIGETYRYKVKLNNLANDLFIEVFRTQKDLYGAFALNNQNYNSVYWFLDDESGSMDNLFEAVTGIN